MILPSKTHSLTSPFIFLISSTPPPSPIENGNPLSLDSPGSVVVASKELVYVEYGAKSQLARSPSRRGNVELNGRPSARPLRRGGSTGGGWVLNQTSFLVSSHGSMAREQSLVRERERDEVGQCVLCVQLLQSKIVAFGLTGGPSNRGFWSSSSECTFTYIQGHIRHFVIPIYGVSTRSPFGNHR